MTINLEEDLVEGAIVEQWLATNSTYKYFGKVVLLEEIDCEKRTFIYEGSLYGFRCWKVRDLDSSFTTIRKIYFRISDTLDIPERFIDEYTYNLEYESKEYLRDNFGESFGTDDS